MAIRLTVEELIQKYSEGKRDFSGIALKSPVVIEDADLRDINLAGCYLGQAKIRRSNLSNANLMRTAWEYSLIEDTNMAEADFRLASFYSTKFSNVNLSIAYFERATLRNSALVKCNLYFTNFEESNLIQASLRGSSNTEHVFRIDKAFVWKLTLPDGSLMEEARIESRDY